MVRSTGLTFHGKLWVRLGLVVMSLEWGLNLSEHMRHPQIDKNVH